MLQWYSGTKAAAMRQHTANELAMSPLPLRTAGPCQHPFVTHTLPLSLTHYHNRTTQHSLQSHYDTTPSPVGSAMAGLIRLALFFNPLIGLPVSGLPSPALNLGGGVLTRLASAGRLLTTRE